ncbi:MAG: exonuclease [Chloroflexi bacterium HGW-Chloroflexi-10]|nr:MAG: exonuclease [Chloroflexi bacterium HGW-Chloroflexi-10]
MPYVMIDIESDGPIPGDYSMISFGAVVVEPDLQRTFYAELKPISEKWLESSLEIGKFTREQTLTFEEPLSVMQRFSEWLKEVNDGRLMFVSDNNGFDWQFINWYLHHFLGQNPFGHSSTNLGSLYKGMVKNMHKNFKHLRRTTHTHNALDDAIGNAESMLIMIAELGLVP